MAGCGGAAKTGPAAKVTIKSLPVDGAEVSIDGVALGVTPVTLDVPKAGQALLVLEKDGYKRTTKSVSIQETGVQEVVVDLEQRVGMASFESDPPGAQVLLDGKALPGQTPITSIEVPVGTHPYEMRKENYRPVSAEITVEEDFRYAKKHLLDPLPGHVSVVSRPTAADIWLNDEPQSQKTPAKFELRPGTYTVRVQAKGCLMQETDVPLAANEDRTVEMTLKAGEAPTGMLLVAAGKFVMGLDGASPDERPRREVDVAAFYIDKFEVTNAQFKAAFPEFKFPEKEDLFPVTNVSFKQASEYALKVGKRLPTEAEWEKAARGEDGREYPWGMEFDRTRCNSKEAKAGKPKAVGQFRAGVSPSGCMDMAGNAYEWTSSWYEAYPGNTDVTAEYGQVFRVLRGGSYRSDRFGVRCARRHYDHMNASRGDYGFRCAKDVEGGPAPGR